MKKVLGTMAILATVAMAGSAAVAGVRRFEPVNVVRNSDNSGYAYGSIGSTRNETSTISHLTCQVSKSGTGSLLASCSAVDAANDYAYCYSADPDFVRLIGAVGEGSYVNFSWDTSSKCTSYTNEVSSWSVPKAP
jgi:hypothetical protein